jgi:hypothetical protein
MSDETHEHETHEKTLREAREEVHAGRLTRDGVTCPACDRLAKVYRRRINVGMCRVLLALARHYRDTDGQWAKIGVGGLATSGGDYSKMRWWGLIESPPEDAERADGSARVGLWRITPLGVQFLRGEITVERYVYEYDSVPVTLELHEGEQPERVNIAQCMGETFDFNEAMRLPAGAQVREAAGAATS